MRICANSTFFLNVISAICCRCVAGT